MIANDFIQIRKVIEHVYEKVLGVLDTNAYSSLGGASSASSSNGAGGVGASTPAGSAATPTGPSPSAGASGTPSSDKGLPGSSGNNGHHNSAAADRQETASIAEEKVELLCNDQVSFFVCVPTSFYDVIVGLTEIFGSPQILEPGMDLRTVRHFIWKSSADLVLHYRPLK